MRTTNLVERLNEEIRRRTKVARLFPNEASCLRLVTAILIEIADEWQTEDRRYLVFQAKRANEGAEINLQKGSCIIKKVPNVRMQRTCKRPKIGVLLSHGRICLHRIFRY